MFVESSESVAASPRLAASRRVRRRLLSRVGLRWTPLYAAALLVVVFALIPVGYIVSETIRTGWDASYPLIVRPRVGELLRNTGALVGAGMAATIGLGVGSAWLVERTSLPARGLWRILLVAPLAVPAFVTSYGWVSLIPSIDGLAGATLITTLAYYPFVFLPVSAALRRLDATLEESAQSLGLGPARVFLRVVLPQLRVPLLGGALLVGLHLLAEYGALQMLSFATFTTAIFDQYSSTFNGTAATMMSLVLVACCMALLAAEVLLRGNGRYARVGSGAARVARPVRLGWTTPAALLTLIAVTVGAVGIPLASTARWLAAGGMAVWTRPELVTATLTTVKYGVFGAVATVALATPIAWLSVRRRGWSTTVMERLTYVTSSLPGIVPALALVIVAIRWARPLYQTTVLVIAVYVLLNLALAMVNLRVGIGQAPPELDESARSLGRSPLAVFARVTARLMAPSIAAGGLLVFLGVVTELTATLLLAPNGVRTLATQFWRYSGEIDYASAAPYALLMVALSAPLTWLLVAASHRAVGRL
jgi:iron(III) transport system permease protein